MEKQTALSWFVKEIQTRLTNDGEVNYVQLAKEAKVKEKEQIVKAFNEGMLNSVDYFGNGFDEAEQYYNEKYNK
jgi:hypothetical protein